MMPSEEFSSISSPVPEGRGNMARSLTEEQLIEGLLAGLVLLGEEKVVTRGDEHHRRFDAVVKELQQAQAKSEPGAAEMPRALHANGVSNRYRELDTALGRLQSGGIFGANNPLYPAVTLNAGPRTASALLERFYTEEQISLLKRFARVYLNGDSASAA
jgi:hypothetical protein